MTALLNLEELVQHPAHDTPTLHQATAELRTLRSLLAEWLEAAADDTGVCAKNWADFEIRVEMALR